VAATPEGTLFAVCRELGEASIEVLDGQGPGAELSDARRISEESSFGKGVQRGYARRVTAFAVVIAHARDV
jgi:hypothetical protein